MYQFLIIAYLFTLNLPKPSFHRWRTKLKSWKLVTDFYGLRSCLFLKPHLPVQWIIIAREPRPPNNNNHTLPDSLWCLNGVKAAMVPLRLTQLMDLGRLGPKSDVSRDEYDREYIRLSCIEQRQCFNSHIQPQLHPYFPYGNNLVGLYQPATSFGYSLPYGYTAHSGSGGFYPDFDDGFYPKGDVGFYPGYSHASYGSQSGGAVTQTNSGGIPYVWMLKLTLSRVLVLMSPGIRIRLHLVFPCPPLLPPECCPNLPRDPLDGLLTESIGPTKVITRRNPW